MEFQQIHSNIQKSLKLLVQSDKTVKEEARKLELETKLLRKRSGNEIMNQVEFLLDQVNKLQHQSQGADGIVSGKVATMFGSLTHLINLQMAILSKVLPAHQQKEHLMLPLSSVLGTADHDANVLKLTQHAQAQLNLLQANIQSCSDNSNSDMSSSTNTEPRLDVGARFTTTTTTGAKKVEMKVVDQKNLRDLSILKKKTAPARAKTATKQKKKPIDRNDVEDHDGVEEQQEGEF